MKIDIFLNTGLMLYPLIILCFAGGIVFFERVLYIHKVQINVKEFISGIKNLLIKDRRIEALTICEETGGSASNLVKVILLNYEASVESIIANLRKRLSIELPQLERRIGLLSVVARISPLIGFLGTFIAGIEIITDLSQLDGSSVQLLSKLSEALISSAIGVIICIFATIGHHFLEMRIAHILDDFEWMSSELIEFILQKREDENK